MSAEAIAPKLKSVRDGQSLGRWMTHMTADVVTSCRELQGESEILKYLLRYATLTGRDALGRSTISLPLNDWLFDQLSALNDNAQKKGGTRRWPVAR